MGYVNDEIERLNQENQTLHNEIDRLATELLSATESHKNILYGRVSGKEMARVLCNFCNSYSSNYKEFTEQIVSEHRTLQQSVMRLMMQTIEQFSKEGYYDGRNEATVLLAKEIITKLDGWHLPLV